MTLTYACALSVTDEKPNIVELDRDDEFTAEERAEIDRIREKAKKRKVTAAPATPAKRIKNEDAEPLTYDAVHNMVVNGVIKGLHPLLSRFDRTDDLLRDINRRVLTPEYDILTYSLAFLVYVLCMSEDWR